jgi:16S rRNA (cytidine1402-2'-O)-methyltransferase
MVLYPGASIAYESPFRLLETLKLADEVCGEWTITVVRELTKLHEEVVKKPVSELVALFQERDVKGECTIVFHPVEKKVRPPDDQLISEVVACRQRFACSLKDAVELVAAQWHVAQRELYKLCIKQQS